MKVKTYEEIFNKQLTIRDLVQGFKEDTKTGKVVAFDGNLNIRPPYQREFIYEADKRREVINTILNGYPLNVMYWAKTDNGTYEMMDGQQRTLSICKFHAGQWHIDINIGGNSVEKTFDNLGDRQEDFLNYPLTVYICDGTEDEKLAWFKIINIAGVRLTDQEMRNAIYNGIWLTNAKYYFSRDDGMGYRSEGNIINSGHIYGDYLNVDTGTKSESENSIVRQKLLETVLSWAVDAYNIENDLTGNSKMTIDGYMDMHRQDPNAKELWRYYEDVMEWVMSTFPTYYKVMKKVDWGILYNRYHDCTPKDADKKVTKIMADEDEITNPKAVFEAVLSSDMRLLNARSFDKKDMQWKYKRQGGICPYCKQHFELSEMHGDHIIPWSKGGKTDRDNLQMLCTACNLKKSAHDVAYTPWSDEEYSEFDLKKWNESQ